MPGVPTTGNAFASGGNGVSTAPNDISACGDDVSARDYGISACGNAASALPVRAGAEDTLKLVPTQADRNAYYDLVMDKKAPPDGPLLCKAYHYFRDQLKTAKDGDDNPVLPAGVLLALERTLQVIMINLDETDDAYLVFESLN